MVNWNIHSINVFYQFYLKSKQIQRILCCVSDLITQCQNIPVSLRILVTYAIHMKWGIALITTANTYAEATTFTGQSDNVPFHKFLSSSQCSRCFFDLGKGLITNRMFAFFWVFYVRLSPDNKILFYWITTDNVLLKWLWIADLSIWRAYKRAYMNAHWQHMI